jgi:hydrogenase maturation protease
MSICVLCVGNPIARDDGIGIRVARILGACSLPAGVAVEERANLAIDVLDLLRAHERIVIVDAMTTGAPPGTCRTLDARDAADLAQLPCCCHALGLAELLRIAIALDPEPVQRQVMLVGVEAGVLDEFGTELSPAVRAALPRAVAMVLGLVGAEPAAVELAVARAQQSTDPGVAELLGIAPMTPGDD